jgi:sulfate-transporting ATPase
LNDLHTVRESVEDGWRGVCRQGPTGQVRGYEEDAILDAYRRAGPPEAIIATAGTDPSNQLEIAADALRLPIWDAGLACCPGESAAAVPAAVQARHAAARRAD